jgi:hypothetical protein
VVQLPVTGQWGGSGEGLGAAVAEGRLVAVGAGVAGAIDGDGLLCTTTTEADGHGVGASVVAGVATGVGLAAG